MRPPNVAKTGGLKPSGPANRGVNMTAVTAPREALNLGRVVSKTFGSIGRNGSTFLVLALILGVAPQMATSFLQARTNPVASGSPGGGFLGLFFFAVLISSVLSMLLQAAVVHGVIDDLNGRRPTISNCLSAGLRLILPLLAIGIVSGTAIAFGLILLIVPGIILSMRWLVAVPARVAEGPGVFAALARSTQLTKGNRWALFGLVFAFWVVLWIVMAVLLGSAFALSFSATNPQAAATGAPYIVMSAVAIAAMQTLGAAGLGATYHELRTVQEGGDPSSLAEVFA